MELVFDWHASNTFNARSRESPVLGGDDGCYLFPTVRVRRWAVSKALRYCLCTGIKMVKTYRNHLPQTSLWTLYFSFAYLLPVAQLPTANKVTYVCGIPATTLVTCGRYYFTMEEQPTRRLIPHLVWTIAQAIGTTGSCLASKF